MRKPVVTETIRELKRDRTGYNVKRGMYNREEQGTTLL